jgi:hypothetical protein
VQKLSRKGSLFALFSPKTRKRADSLRKPLSHKGSLLMPATAEATRAAANDRLFRAAERGDIGGLRAALTDGADKIDLALQSAAKEGWALATAYLLDQGANPNVFLGYCLAAAAGGGYLEIVQQLLDRGADPNARSAYALAWAAERDHAEIVETLLDHGANIHAGDDWALREAAAAGCPRTVPLLLRRGANVLARNSEALEVARKNPFHPELVALLEEAATRASAERPKILYDYSTRAERP